MSASDLPINLNPGPVPLSTTTWEAMQGPLVSHRSPEFEALNRDCRSRLRSVFQTDGEIVVANGNGNIGLELAAVNGIRPNDRVLCLKNGKFGTNLEEMAERHAGEVNVIEADWGQPLDLGEIELALSDETDAVLMTHCETSTGMLNPVRKVAQLANEHGALSLIDGVSSIGGERLPVDDWGIDMAVTASQKCLSAPPGLSAVSFSDTAIQRAASNPRTMPYNLDLQRYRGSLQRDQTPSTAPVPTYRALSQSLAEFLEIGMERSISVRAEQAKALRRVGRAMGFDVFPTPDSDSQLSNTVTVLEPPENVSASELVTKLESKGIWIRTGIGHTAENVIRIATMSSAISNRDIKKAVRTLETVVDDWIGSVDSAAVTESIESLPMDTND